jgi:hypothetical protein
MVGSIGRLRSDRRAAGRQVAWQAAKKMRGALAVLLAAAAGSHHLDTIGQVRDGPKDFANIP